VSCRTPGEVLLADPLAFVAINARNLLTFGLTYFVIDWLAKDGVLNVFNVLGSTFGKISPERFLLC